MLARQYADALVADGQLDKAAQFLRDQVQQYREEPKLYDQLAKTYAAQGKIALQHMALAESYVLTGALPAAVDSSTWRARRKTCRSTTRPSSTPASAN
jgi:predicted Zn-dependent protease